MKHKLFLLFSIFFFLLTSIYKPIYAIDDFTSSDLSATNKYFLCGDLDSKDFKQIKWDIDNVASFNPDGMNLVLRTTYDSSTNEFTTSQSLESFYQTYEYALEKNIPTIMIRISATRYNWNPNFKNNFESWKVYYYNLLQQVVTHFSGKNIPYFCVMNETNTCYGNEENDAFTLQCINLAKSAGFKVGISCGGVDDAKTISPTVLNNLDFVGINIFPKTYIKSKSTDYNKWLDTMNSYKKSIIEYKAYCQKPIFITEIGICDSWECQYKTNTYNKGTLSNGILPEIFWKAYFDSGIQNECLGTSMWFWEASKNYNNVKEVIKYYNSMP